jgi:excisionase family DNA binding protein
MMREQAEILTIEDARALLRVSRPAMYQLIASGDLKASRIGRKSWRITRREILRFCEAGYDRKRKKRGPRMTNGQ